MKISQFNLEQEVNPEEEKLNETLLISRTTSYLDVSHLTDLTITQL